ncbi:GAF and ANTAR domain-containing protein [Phycicoccus sp. Root101]|uniref:GAF and ANTAR domain-containing protein n=1 Tax=Phycicoccus sp. Root101 TaxID=1736421 RepID=UPI00070279E2|nr:GAF and ANTAR domain-containing protein [Phycicoccus sp. Root101]KQU70881.1 hypothetical protein ASC58_03725 [Phycicoccus sp. Root101]
MEPIRETRFALTEMSRFRADDLTARFTATANRVALIAPDCMGMTLSYVKEGHAFTWAASSLDVAALDALQYLDDGPCLQAMDTGDIVAAASNDPLDEETWRLFSRAENSAGVESTLSIPLFADGRVTGGVNFYGRTPAAFDGLHEQLAAEWGGWAQGAVTNADLSLTGVRRAKETPQKLLDGYVTDQAIGMLMAVHHVPSEAAAQRLSDAAHRAGIHEVELARLLVKSRII